jgi:hypothetical protein
MRGAKRATGPVCGLPAVSCTPGTTGPQPRSSGPQPTTPGESGKWPPRSSRVTGLTTLSTRWSASGTIRCQGSDRQPGKQSRRSRLPDELRDRAAPLIRLPVCVGVAVLRYRLYEIDRIVSRTLAYAIVTGLLIGVYGGLVLLATRVLSFHTPVAVAASTLAAAALFNPLRRRVQLRVDRRFNRAQYDADQNRWRTPAPGRRPENRTAGASAWAGPRAGGGRDPPGPTASWAASGRTRPGG